MNVALIGSRMSAKRAMILGLQARNSFLSSSRCLTTSIAKLSPNTQEDFFERNKRLNRPMSPHLTIYKPQITSLLSLTHRGTGLALSGLMSGFAIGMMMLPGNFPCYLEMINSMHLGPALIGSVKFTLSFPFFFHFFNGIRHLAWDLGWGFRMKSVYKTGYLVLGLSTLASLVASFL